VKVFVWISHGEPSVYLCETEEQKAKLKSELIECLKSEGSDVSENDSWPKIVRSIDDQRYSDSDMFEYGTGFYTVRE
jgi:hypothetical protein